MEAEQAARVWAKASAYLVGSREDGHEPTQHGGADAGDVDERALEVTDSCKVINAEPDGRLENRGPEVGRLVSEQMNP